MVEAIITARGRWVNDSKPASKLIESPLLVLSAMGLGFNSNVELGATVYHVQTEDRGLHHPFVDTVVLFGGQVLYRRSDSYQDLLRGTAIDEAALRARVEGQHLEVMEALRAGSLSLDDNPPAAIEVKLCNPTSWLVAGQASLEVEVLSRAERKPIAGVEVQASIEGAEGEGAKGAAAKAESAQTDGMEREREKKALQFATQTGADGRARLHFRMPKVADHENPALVIRARAARAQDQIRYRLRPKPPQPEPPTP
jgi:hypothetical protein